MPAAPVAGQTMTADYHARLTERGSDVEVPTDLSPASIVSASTVTVDSVGEADRLIEQGEVEAAQALVRRLLARDPVNAQAWFVQARLLAAQGNAADAFECCRRAIELWPDILPVARLALSLGTDAGDFDQVLEMARLLAAAHPEDLVLKNRLAGLLCTRGALDEALPLLRLTAPVLKHQDSALWNYTASLANSGLYEELLTLEPMLDELAATVLPPYGPYVHLAAAKMASLFDRERVLAESKALRESATWLDAAALTERLAAAIAAERPFSFVSFSPAEARFLTYLETRNHIVLRPGEMSAVVNSVWQDWFGTVLEAEGAARIGALCSAINAAIDSADVIGLPSSAVVETSHAQYGFVAEMQRRLLRRSDRAIGSANRCYTDEEVNRALHEAMPFLRPLLAGLPFLGFVGCHARLVDRLRHFCGIEQVAKYIVPAERNRSSLPEDLRAASQFPDPYEHVLSTLTVPYPGAVFLVAAGFLGKSYAGRIRALGGIAIEIGALADRWAGF